jgi:hypothetical protein
VAEQLDKDISIDLSSIYKGRAGRGKGVGSVGR